jgi:hypothetical protein
MYPGAGARILRATLSAPSVPAPPPAVAAPKALSGRRVATIWTLVALASLIGLLAILTTWVNRQLLDNASWKKASTQVIQDPQVQSALSVYLVNQLYDNVDVAGALQQRLPPILQGLAAPLAGALQQPATDAVGRMLARPRVQQLFINASVLAHEKLVNVLENKTGHGISTGNGVVTLDLGQLVTELGTELGVPQGALAQIPPNTGVITVMKSDQLSTAQASVQALKVLSVWLLVIVLVMFGAAIYIAHGIRRETLRNVGWAFVIVGMIVLVVRQVAGNYAISSLTNPPYDKPAHDVFLIASSTLGDIGWATIIYGAVAIVGAVLAGPSRYAIEARRFIAPVLHERQGMVWLGAGIVYLLLVLWGPTHALRTVWGVLLLGALLALGIWAFRRETMREFPPAPPGTLVPAP